MRKSNLLPIVTLKWAQTIDGQLADDQDHSQWISGKQELVYTHQLRAQHQAVLVGARTFLKDRCQLTVREVEYHGPQPVRILADPRGRIIQALQRDPTLHQALVSGARTTYLLTDVPDDEDDFNMFRGDPRLRKLTYRFETFENWLRASVCQLTGVFELYENRELKKLMVEGGPATLAEFLKAGLVDRVEVAISPFILGGTRHRVTTGNLLANAPRFEVDSHERLGSDYLLRYRIHRPDAQMAVGV